jgi:hypothetical protein
VRQLVCLYRVYSDELCHYIRASAYSQMIIGLVRVTRVSHLRSCSSDLDIGRSLCYNLRFAVGAVVAILAPTAHVTVFWPALVSPFSPLSKVKPRDPWLHKSVFLHSPRFPQRCRNRGNTTCRDIPSGGEGMDFHSEFLLLFIETSPGFHHDLARSRHIYICPMSETLVALLARGLKR